MTGTYPSGGTADAAGSCLDALTAKLAGQGLDVVVLCGGLLTVRNPAADPRATDETAKRMSHGMSQTVACRFGADGRLWWYWVWSGKTGDSAPDFEPLCPAPQTDLAATRIAQVLSVLRQRG